MCIFMDLMPQLHSGSPLCSMMQQMAIGPADNTRWGHSCGLFEHGCLHWRMHAIAAYCTSLYNWKRRAPLDFNTCSYVFMYACMHASIAKCSLCGMFLRFNRLYREQLSCARLFRHSHAFGQKVIHVYYLCRGTVYGWPACCTHRTVLHDSQKAEWNDS